MFTRADAKYEKERKYARAMALRLTEGACDVCKENQRGIMSKWDRIYDLVIDVPRHSIIEVGPDLGPQYIVYKLAELLGHRYIMEGIYEDESADLEYQNMLWKYVCRHMEWTYIH